MNMLPSSEYNDEHGENLRRRAHRTAWFEYLEREQGGTELYEVTQVDNPHGLRYFSVTNE